MQCHDGLLPLRRRQERKILAIVHEKILGQYRRALRPIQNVEPSLMVGTIAPEDKVYDIILSTSTNSPYSA